VSSIDPGEIRWPSGAVRIGYLGEERWRVDASSDERSAAALVDLLMRALEEGPRGALVPIAAASNSVARDLGIVRFIAPRACDEVRVVWREDLVGKLPPGLPVIDVVAVIADGTEYPYHRPLLDYARYWLSSRGERCRAIGVPLPSERLGSEFSIEAFDASPDRAALGARLDAVVAARVAASRSPQNTFWQVLRELDALGHDCDFSDSDGDWEVWASRHLTATWFGEEKDADEDERHPPNTCRIEVG
jgi:hypothetical protein